jgi:predicted aminopeptidase
MLRRIEEKQKKEINNLLFLYNFFNFFHKTIVSNFIEQSDKELARLIIDQLLNELEFFIKSKR